MTYRSLDQTQTPLLSTLQSLASKDYAPFHTPGHKRGKGASAELRSLLGSQLLQADLPELPELDNLFAPQGVIQAAQTLAAEAFGADQTWFLANGSTCGIIAAILATCNPDEKIILPRNVHYSVISGLILSGAIPIFIQPEYNPVWDIAHCITPATVEAALMAHPDAKAVMMVYPTYHGICGDMGAIAQLCHQHNIPLLVDEAHGSHFAFHPDLPTPALAAGADLSVQSIHKTLSALTQAAMLHVRGDRIDRTRISKSLALVQSTSPNYLLLASLDAARHQMATQGKDLLAETLQLADSARQQLKQIPQLEILDPTHANTPGFTALDRTRLTVRLSALGMDGFTADEILHNQFGVTCELPSLHHLTFIISLGNTAEDIERLVVGMQEIGREAEGRRQKVEGRGQVGDGEEGEDREEKNKLNPYRPDTRYPTPDTPFPYLTPNPRPPTPGPPLLSPRTAYFAPTETLSTEQAVDRISAELVCPYPPGIPILMPGELVTESAIAYLNQILEAGGIIISGGADPTFKTLKVIRN